MFDEFRTTVSVESSKSLGPQGQLGLASNKSNGSNDSEKFNSDNIDYFDLFYENKSINIVFIIEYTEKSIFFHNIYIFFNRVKNIVRVKDNALLR